MLRTSLVNFPVHPFSQICNDAPQEILEAPECFQGDFLAFLSFFLIFARKSFTITIDGDWEVISSKFRFPLQRIPSLLSFIPIFP